MREEGIEQQGLLGEIANKTNVAQKPRPQSIILNPDRNSGTLWPQFLEEARRDPEIKAAHPGYYDQAKVSTFLRTSYRDFLDAWHLALKNSGTPLDFADRHSYGSHTVDFNGVRIAAGNTANIDQDLRKKIIQGQKVHKRCHADLTAYEYYLSPEGPHTCNLCQNIIQGLDALTHPEVRTGFITTFDKKYVWMINKFPYNVGDTLISPIAHDDLSIRAESTKDAQGVTHLPVQLGKTRESLLTSEYVEIVIGICDQYGQAAQRNHAMDGKTQPHDHFKLCPEVHRAFNASMVIDKNQGLDDAVQLYAPPNTPFDTLAIASKNRVNLARKLTEIVNSLEQAGEVYTLCYYRGHWLITPRFKDKIGDVVLGPLGTGSGVGCHMIENPAENPRHLNNVRALVPLKGEFKWARYL